MSSKLEVGIAVVERALKSDAIGKFLCGEYTDGSVRSIPDAIRGEEESPKDRRKRAKKKNKRKGYGFEGFYVEEEKKHKKKKKKKKKHKKNKSSVPKKLVL